MRNSLNVTFDGNFIEKIFYNVVLFIKEKFYYVNIKKISQAEKGIIRKFFNNTLNEYSLDSVPLAENDITYPVILKLIHRKILKKLNIYEKIDNYDGNGVKYQLTNKAWKKLNKRKFEI